MGYIEEISTELRQRLSQETNPEELITYVIEKILESYKNGIKAAKRTMGKSKATKPYNKTYGKS